MMNISTSFSSVSGPQGASNHDELLMQQSLLFSDTLKDLKNLRKQLYSAADYFEISYRDDDQKQLVVETLKHYAMNSLINTIDHLGSVAYKFNSFLDQKTSEVSEVELRFSCVEQTLQTCKYYINQGGLSQQSSLIKTPVHHKRYMIPVKEKSDTDIGNTESGHQNKCVTAKYNLHFRNAVQATIKGVPSSLFREGWSPQFLLRQGTPSFTRTWKNKGPEKGAASPMRFSLGRSGSLLRRSTSPNNTSAIRRYPSEPRSASLSTFAGRDRINDTKEYSSKSKHLFKALLSTSKSSKDIQLPG